MIDWIKEVDEARERLDNGEEKYFIWVRSPHDDETWIEVDYSFFKELEPFRDELAQGYGEPPDSLSEKLWELVAEEGGLDLRPSEINVIPNSNIIEVLSF